MATINVREGEALESAVRRFKKKCEQEGILKAWKEKQFFVKPSMKKRLKLKESIRKAKNKARRRTFRNNQR